jgi:hypothetical protein
MACRTAVPAIVGTLFLAIGCQDPASVSPPADPPIFAEAPATGNGNKLVFPVDEDLPSVECEGGDFLEEHQDGWVQIREFKPGNRNVELDVFHLVTTFTNSAGETFVFRDVGPDHFYLEDGNLIVVASSGRLGGFGLFGRVVFNLTTGEVEFVAGKQFGGAEALACEALT